MVQPDEWKHIHNILVVYAMSTTLVTGADGFIGSHLTEALVLGGSHVRALVQYNSFDSWGWLDTAPEDIKSAIEVVPDDLRTVRR